MKNKPPSEFERLIEDYLAESNLFGIDVSNYNLFKGTTHSATSSVLTIETLENAFKHLKNAQRWPFEEE